MAQPDLAWHTTGASNGHPNVNRNSVVASILVGLFTAAVVVGCGVVIVGKRPARWESRTSMLVVPRQGEPQQVASYYDTLSRGQIVATFAEIARGQPARAPASAATRDTAVQVNVVPNTAIIAVNVGATAPSLASSIANDVADRTVDEVAALNQPYVLSIVSRGKAVRAALPASSLALVVAGVALALGLTAQQAVYQVLGLLAPRRRTQPTEELSAELNGLGREIRGRPHELWASGRGPNGDFRWRAELDELGRMLESWTEGGGVRTEVERPDPEPPT